MSTPKNVTELVDNWPRIGDFADAIGVGYEAARQMRSRNSISPSHWPRVIKAANEKGIEGITLEWLTNLRASSDSVEAAE